MYLFCPIFAEKCSLKNVDPVAKILGIAANLLLSDTASLITILSFLV
jgi:hypothetical protein